MLRLSSTLLALVAFSVDLVSSASTTTSATACHCVTTLRSGPSTIPFTIYSTPSCSKYSLAVTCPGTSTTAIPSTRSSTSSSSSSPSKVTSSSFSTSSISSTRSTSSSCRPTPTKSSGKRGVAYNSTPLTNLFSLSCVNSKSSWAYNWYSALATDGLASSYNSVLTYVPMLWSNASDLTSVWSTNAKKAIASGSDSLLAFNEPDNCGGGSSCMDISSAVSAYKTYMQPFAGKARLGAPAVTNGVAPQGLAYLQSFLKSCTACTVDFVPIHWYGDASQAGAFLSYVQGAYTAGGNRTLWITEFACTSGTQDQIVSFLSIVLPWLDRQSYVERYSYFMAAPGMLVNNNGTALSSLGVKFDQA